MATSFDLGGLLGSAFGADEYGDLLTPAQQSAIQQRALLSAASALLQAGAPSTTRTSLGQALGAALTAGQTGAERAQQSALTGMLTRQKLEEARRAREMEENIAKIFAVGQQAAPAAGGEITPDMALAAPVTPEMPAGPTVARAGMIGQAAPAAPAMSPNEMQAQRYRDAARLYTSRGKTEDAKRMIDIAEQLAPSRQEVVGDIVKGTGGRAFQRTKTGGFIEVPPEMVPAAKPVGPRDVVTDPKTGNEILVQGYDDGSIRTVEGFGPRREVVLQNVDGKIVAIDKSTVMPGQTFGTGRDLRLVDLGGRSVVVDMNAIPPGTSFAKSLAPQVVGGAESGFFVVGGGGGGAASPRALAAGAPAAAAPVATPSAPAARTPAAGAAATAPAGAQPAAAKPTGPQPIIPGTGAAFKNEETLRREFTTTMEPYVKLAQAYKKIETAATNVSGAGDVSLIYGYMKILDPGSTVMQGEQATAANAGSVPATIRSFYNRALTGERLDPTVRNDFLAQARNIIESQRELSNDVVSRYRRLAEEYDLKPNRITFDPFQNIKTPEQIIRGSTPPASGTTPPVPTTQRGFFDRFNLIPR
jgi:hypothetical protein